VEGQYGPSVQLVNHMQFLTFFSGRPMNRIMLAAMCIMAINWRLEAQTPRPCPPNDSTTAHVVQFAIGVVSDTGQFARTVRTNYGIPAASASVVSTVQDAAACDSATAAVDAVSSAPRATSLITVRIGTTPVFFLLARPAVGGPGEFYLIDASYTLLTSFIGQ
jgi:hypothetical protein